MIRNATHVYALARYAQSTMECSSAAYMHFVRHNEHYRSHLDMIYTSIYSSANEGRMNTYVKDPIPMPIQIYLNRNGFVTDSNTVSWIRADVERTAIVDPIT